MYLVFFDNRYSSFFGRHPRVCKREISWKIARDCLHNKCRSVIFNRPAQFVPLRARVLLLATVSLAQITPRDKIISESTFVPADMRHARSARNRALATARRNSPKRSSLLRSSVRRPSGCTINSSTYSTFALSEMGRRMCEGNVADPGHSLRNTKRANPLQGKWD